jgi:hypothetical protein
MRRHRSPPLLGSESGAVGLDLSLVHGGTRSAGYRQGGFCTWAPSLRQVAWPDKFMPRPIDKYDGPSNPEEFI